ncbi:MAG: hypothetical protein ACKO54_26620 [Alphaproteobacteria bacterium]
MTGALRLKEGKDTPFRPKIGRKAINIGGNLSGVTVITKNRRCCMVDQRFLELQTKHSNNITRAPRHLNALAINTGTPWTCHGFVPFL